MKVKAGVRAFKTPTIELLKPNCAAQNRYAGMPKPVKPMRVMYFNLLMGTFGKLANAIGLKAKPAAAKRKLATCQGENATIPRLTRINELPQARVRTKKDPQMKRLLLLSGDFIVLNVLYRVGRIAYCNATRYTKYTIFNSDRKCFLIRQNNRSFDLA